MKYFDEVSKYVKITKEDDFAYYKILKNPLISFFFYSTMLRSAYINYGFLFRKWQLFRVS